MFFERFKMLCDYKKISPTKASTEIGFSKGLVSRWNSEYKKGNDVTPGMEIAQKIATYFDVSLDYLLRNDVTVEPLQEYVASERPRHVLRDKTPIALIENPIFNDRELLLIDAYRRHPELQPLIDQALGLAEYDAYNADNSQNE